MTTIPLAQVVVFLRRHNALQVLEGAPFMSHLADSMFAIRPYEATEANIDWMLSRYPEAVLYLGTNEVCPAAEGWALRVLGLARPCAGMWEPLQPRWIYQTGVSVVLMASVNENIHRWTWRISEPEERVTMMPGPTPPTPAERLAAVLRFELERA